MNTATVALQSNSSPQSIQATKQRWSFTASFEDQNGYPRWSVTSSPVYESKGEALFFAYATCKKRGFTPQTRGISISTKQHE